MRVTLRDAWLTLVSGSPMAPLSEVTRDDAPNRQILVEIWPMQTVGRELDIAELLLRFVLKPRIPRDWKG